jgi:hypothetical protein
MGRLIGLPETKTCFDEFLIQQLARMRSTLALGVTDSCRQPTATLVQDSFNRLPAQIQLSLRFDGVRTARMTSQLVTPPTNAPVNPIGPLHSCIAVVERFHRTCKGILQLITIPEHRSEYEREVSLVIEWYNEHRPHNTCVPSYRGICPTAMVSLLGRQVLPHLTALFSLCDRVQHN